MSTTSAPIFLQSTAKLYRNVIDEVCLNIKEAFIDEGIEESVLKEMKQIWEAKVLATKAIDSFNPQPPKPPPQPHNYETPSQPQASLLRDSASAVIPQFSAYRSPSASTPTVSFVRSQPPPGVIVRPSTMATTTFVIPHQTLISGTTGSFIMPMSGAPGTTIRVINPNQFPGLRLVAINQVPSSDGQVRMNVVVPNSNHPPNHNQSGSDQVHQLDGPPGCAQSTKSKPKRNTVKQLDGPGGASDDEVVDEDDLPASDDDDIEEDFDQAGYVDEGEPLNSDDDDLVNENAIELFEADDVVVCQFEKVTRAKNKWKFALKDGIMNLRGKDYVFNKATGESDF